ncbi:MAG: ABC transporter permease [Lachnospiraceae bacterium]|nr:ABC transporter permease [Lachnospiraceae bacterium]
MMKKILSTLILGFALLFMYVPILLLAIYSFTDSTTIGAIRSFSLDNYVTLFTTEELREMIGGTLALALISALIATVLGTLGAIGTFYSKKTIKAVVNSANQVPIINADVVTGFSICVLMIIVLGMEKDTFIPLLVGHVTLSAPFVYTSVVPKLKQMDSSLYEAALDLGCSPSEALFKVVIPQIIPGILSGFMLAITLSLDDYFITTYTKPATFDTISTYVVNATRGSQTEIKTALWALSTVIFIVVVLVVVAMNLSTFRKKGEEA